MTKLLLYCTKAKPYLNDYRNFEFCNKFVIINKNVNALNGKIVAECDCDKVEFIKLIDDDPLGTTFYQTDTLDEEDLCNKSNLINDELYYYLGENNGYALHLSNVKVFDEPRELNKYYKVIEYYKDKFLQELNYYYTKINKAPQNMCYVYDRKGNKYILISIRPEWLCKILNGEKTIEIRKQIVNDLKKKDN